MASKRELTTEGDNEGPVREKLKETYIDTLLKDGVPTVENDGVQAAAESSSELPAYSERADGAKTTDTEAENSNGHPRGRHTRKRSYDDLNDTSEQGDGHHTKHSETVMGESKRKRSSDAGSQELSGPENDEEYLRDSPVVDTAHESDKIMSEDNDSLEGRSRVKTATPDRDETMVESRVLSPKKKRSRDQFDKDFAESAVEQDAAAQTGRSSGESERDATSTGRASRRSNREEPEKKRPRDVSKDTLEKTRGVDQDLEPPIPKDNSSKDTSGILATEKSFGPSKGGAALSPLPQTSSSAFAASGFGALASSSASPFGTLAPQGTGIGTRSFGSFGAPVKPSGSTFGGFGSSTTTATAPLTSFASAAKSDSAFGNATSGFGTLSGGGSSFGGGFGAPLGGGLKSFGSSGGSTIVGLKQTAAKPFGIPAGEDSDGSSGEDEDDEEYTSKEKDGSVANRKESKQDQRFQLQEVETGEAGEDTILTCRAKLFHFSKDSKAWKERGIGVLKLNTPIESDDEDDDDHEDDDYDKYDNIHDTIDEHSSSPDDKTERKDVARAETPASVKNVKKKPRLIMRADGVMRVLLNAPILKEMSAKIASVNQPNVVSMTIIEDGEPLGIRLRINTAVNAKALCQEIENITKTL